MSVTQYVAQFTQFSRFAPCVYLDEADRANKYKEGLHNTILDSIISIHYPTMSEVINTPTEWELYLAR